MFVSHIQKEECTVCMSGNKNIRAINMLPKQFNEISIQKKNVIYYYHFDKEFMYGLKNTNVLLS